MNECTFIILGATGDLAKRKLIPAIYRLVKDNKITTFAIIGTSRRKLTPAKILNNAKPFIKNLNKKAWKKLENAMHFHQLDFDTHDDYLQLSAHIKNIEQQQNLPGNRLFYLATLPQHFDKITHCMGKAKLNKSRGWNRIVYEKPFGYDLKSARNMNKCISRVFNEKQVFRIDHYLGKEIVGNIALVRFTNRVLEPLWNNKHVESVDIILSETLGVEGRGDFYDSTGALRDVVQNHMLQLLALTAMEEPKRLSGEHIRTEKANVLKQTTFKKGKLGQYRGYTKEKGVKKNSNTETFARITLHVNTPRWKNIPFTITTGKKLDKREAIIRLNLKRVKCLLDYCPREPNHIEMRIQPDLGLAIYLNAKVPNKQEVTPVKMDFCYECLFANTPEAYEVLLQDVIKGDQTTFVRNDEIEHAWKIIDTIRKKKLPLTTYKPGSKEVTI